MDTEANGLLDTLTHFHCLVFKPIKEDRFYAFCDYKSLSPEEMSLFSKDNVSFFETQDYLKLINSEKTKCLICHNILNYDLEAMKKLDGIDYGVGPDFIDKNDHVRIIDSLVLSRYLSPDRKLPTGCPTAIKTINPDGTPGKSRKIASHGLSAWGYRTGIKKPDIDDWSNQPLHVYLDRCIEDVKINEATYFLLQKEIDDVAIPNGDKKGDWDLPLRLAHKTYHLMNKQEKTGILFDIPAAEALVIRIDKEMQEIAAKVEPILGERELPEGQQPNYPKSVWKKAFDYDRAFTAAGKLKKGVTDYLCLLGYNTLEEQMNYIRESIVDGAIDPNKIEKHESLLTTGIISYCEKVGITDKKDILAEVKRVEAGGVPKRLTEKMLLSHKKETRYYLLEHGWSPTIIRGRDILTDKKTKQKLSDDKVQEGIERYLKEFGSSPMWPIICNELGYKKPVMEPYTASFIEKIKKNGRNLPSSPQLTDVRGVLCENLEKINADVAKDIVRYLSLQNRRTTLKSFDNDTGWLNNKRLKVDSRLPARSSGIASSGRQKHSVICNLPKPDPKVVLGKEIRSLFIPGDGKMQVGCDCQGLEARVTASLSAKFDGGAYAREMLEGDQHQKNADAYSKAVGFEITRSQGKNITYALSYGAAAAKIASMASVDMDKGLAIVESFWNANEGLRLGKEALEKYWERTGKKYIMGIDGRKLFVRSKHSILNTYGQGVGNILMDFACCKFDADLKKTDTIFERTLYIHK